MIMIIMMIPFFITEFLSELLPAQIQTCNMLLRFRCLWRPQQSPDGRQFDQAELVSSEGNMQNNAKHFKKNPWE